MRLLAFGVAAPFVLGLVGSVTAATVNTDAWFTDPPDSAQSLVLLDEPVAADVPDVLVNVDAGVEAEGGQLLGEYVRQQGWDPDRYLAAITSPKPEVSPWKYAMLAAAYACAIGVVACCAMVIHRVRQFDAPLCTRVVPIRTAHSEALPISAIFDATAVRGHFPQQHAGSGLDVLEIPPSPLLSLGMEPAAHRDRVDEAIIEVRRRAHAAIEFLDERTIRRVSTALEDELRDQLLADDTAGRLGA